MAYKTAALYFGSANWTLARSATELLAIDSATLTDANIPTAQAVDCTGLETILVKVAITAGTNPTITVEPLFYDSNAADGSRWARRVNGSGAITTAALIPGQEQEITVDGSDVVFLRKTAVTNVTSTTAWAIYARPGKRSVARPPSGR